MKKILIITYYWPPSGGPGVQRWLKFSKYLPEFGYDPIIITVDPEKAEYPIKDHTLEQDVRAGQIVYRTDCSGIYEYYKKLTKFLEGKNEVVPISPMHPAFCWRPLLNV